MPLEGIEVVLSHPQASAQCARFIRESLPRAEVRGAPSTAEAVRTVAESDEPWAALGAESAARLYGAAVLRHGVEDEPDNITRFVWVAPEGASPSGSGPWRTSLVFSELGEDHPGALVDALQVFSDRAVNLTRIESRPLRRGLGRYQFFLDIEGASADEPAAPRRSRRCARRPNPCGFWAAGRSPRRPAFPVAGGREDARARVSGTRERLEQPGSWRRSIYNRAGYGQRGHRRAGCGQRP